MLRVHLWLLNVTHVLTFDKFWKEVCEIMSYQHEKFLCHVYVHVLTKRNIETLFRNACPCKVLKKQQQKYLNILLPVICLQRQDDSLFLQTFPLCLINNLQTSSCSRLARVSLICISLITTKFPILCCSRSAKPFV